ncbi:hypothetical protein [Methanocalculus taiwanensis]|uniref:hypothetical protein n=1 Tax=Methanocalculus taiwanensis TaxID=106207 RepID=UPI0021008CDF|nr:hypothetical protein [Methanocalculus taiwanensis]
MHNPTVSEGRSAGAREEARVITREETRGITREETGEKIITLIQTDSSLTVKEIVERL